MYRYRYDWKREEAEKNILRTHTTAISARMLYQLGQKVALLPGPLLAPPTGSIALKFKLAQNTSGGRSHRAEGPGNEASQKVLS